MKVNWLKLQKKSYNDRNGRFNDNLDTQNKEYSDKNNENNDYKYISSYVVSPIIINESQIRFVDYNNNVPILLRNNTYIFDLEHPSNRNHNIIISRNPDSGIVKDLIFQGIPGFPGSYLSLYIGEMRPSILYYYDKYNKGFGGKIIIID